MLISGTCALAVGLSSPAAGAGAVDRVQRAGVLRWGGDVQGGQPFVAEDPQHPGTLVGFEVDLVEALAARLGVRAQFVQNDWPTLVASLERGSFDVLVNGFEATPQRAARLRLSRPYYLFQERLVVRTGDPQRPELAALRGRRVGTLASSYAWDLLGQAGADRIPYEGVREPFIDLGHGRIDAVLIDDVIAARYGQGPGLMVAGDVAPGRYVAAVRPADGDLADALDAGITALAASGRLRTIFERHGVDNARQALLVADAAPTTESNPLAGGARRLGRGDLLLFLHGAGVTVVVSSLAMMLAVAGGLLLALARRPAHGTGRRVLAAAATVYVELFRGTPVLLQLYVLYFGLANVLALGPLTAAVIGLGLNYAAYEAEVYRAGLAAVPVGQVEAGRALGMTEVMVLRRVVLPQALRVSLPAVTNDFIALLKDSSLVSVITVVELTKRMTITSVDVGSWIGPGLLCAALYISLSYPLARLARRAEARLGRGFASA